MPVLPENFAAADMILPEARLGFMDAVRNRLAQRRAVVLRRQSLIVKPVAGLVHDAV